MKKLLRFVLLFITAVILWILFFTTVPTIVFIIFGYFKPVIQHPAYVAFFSIICSVATGAIISECFDSEFLPKK